MPRPAAAPRSLLDHLRDEIRHPTTDLLVRQVLPARQGREHQPLVRGKLLGVGLSRPLALRIDRSDIDTLDR